MKIAQYILIEKKTEAKRIAFNKIERSINRIYLTSSYSKLLRKSAIRSIECGYSFLLSFVW